MAKKTKEPEFDMTLEEFCSRLSATDKRVELISGFHAEARKNGVRKATDSVFRAEFNKYLRRPILG